MLQKQLALHHGVTTAAVSKWGAETKRRKTIEAEAGVNPQIRKLIGEISELCYIFDCKKVQCEKQTEYSLFRFNASLAKFFVYDHSGERIIFSLPEIDLSASDAIERLQQVKSTLEAFVYNK